MPDMIIHFNNDKQVTAKGTGSDSKRAESHETNMNFVAVLLQFSSNFVMMSSLGRH
jgi:hypothetical protein